MVSQFLQEFATQRLKAKNTNIQCYRKEEWSFEVMEITYKSRDRG